MSKVLILSHASINRPHRRAYEVLARAHGWEVHIAVPARFPISEGKYKECEPPEEGSRLVLHHTRVRFVENGRFVFYEQLGALVRSLAPDVIFAEYDPGTVAILHAAAVARRAGIPVVAFTPENIERSRARDALSAVLGRRPKEAARDLTVSVLDAAGKRAADGLACVNEEGRRIFRTTRRWNQPIEVVPLGTDTQLFSPMHADQVRAELGFGTEVVLGYFGRLIPEKGVHLIVEALAELPSDTKLLLDMYSNFLPGSYAESLLTKAEQLGVRGRIVTVDVPHHDVPKYMSACDIVVVPSISSERWIEQYGRVVPEAMACGVPVVGSSSGNIPVLIGDAGLVFQEGSVPALVQALRQLIDDPALRQRLGQQGRLRCIERWSIEVQAQIMDRLLRSVMARVGAA